MFITEHDKLAAEPNNFDFPIDLQSTLAAIILSVSKRKGITAMLLRQLKYFLAVVDTGSFTEAAAQCFISQSAISQQIQALERELGVELIHRENRKFALTEAGKYFYQKGRLLADEAERLCRETAKIGKENSPRLHIGYLKCYSGLEFQMAVAEFSRQHPEVSIEIIDGNHEDLYDALRTGIVDVILNDQRRAFSDAYVNRVLTTTECYIELSRHSSLAQRESLTAEDLRSLPCILTVSPEQQENERTYYREIVGLEGEFLFVENMEQARLMVAGGKGYLPVEGIPKSHAAAATLHRIPLLRGGKPILRTYCAFWKISNQNPHTKAFAEILESQFQ